MKQYKVNVKAIYFYFKLNYFVTNEQCNDVIYNNKKYRDKYMKSFQKYLINKKLIENYNEIIK